MIGATDNGFLYPAAARAAVRRMKLRRGLHEVEALVPALLDRLDQAGDAYGHVSATASDRGIALAGDDCEGCVRGRSVDFVEGQDVREEELLRGVDLVLQFLDSLFDALGHGRFSVISNTPNANPAAPGDASSK